MVRAQKRLMEKLGISRWLAVIGGSMGGMQVLEWAATYPEAVYAAAPIAAAAHHSAQNIAFHEVGRAAIHSDPDWRGGRYWEADIIPAKGLSVARMVAHITYLSEKALTRKFGRRLRGAAALTFLEDVFEVESYLRHQGSTFVRRFDANSYLTITRAMDFFDLAADHEGDLAKAFRGTGTRFFVASFNSDWLFPTSESRTLVRALNMAAANVSFVEIDSDKGHDAFLLEEPDFHRALGGFLAGCAERLGV
jgi:homoserine O-acetyltransferase